MVNKNLDSALLEAISRFDATALVDLINQGADPNIILPSKNPLLVEMCFNGTVELSKFILSKGADINAKNPLGQISLDGGVGKQDSEFVQFLLSKGANADNRYSNGLSTLAIAITTDNLEITEMLLKAGADPNAVYQETVDKDKKDFLKMALKENWFKKPEVGMTLFVDEQTAKDIVSGKTKTLKSSPLTIAKNNPAMVKLLKKYGAKS